MGKGLVIGVIIGLVLVALLGYFVLSTSPQENIFPNNSSKLLSQEDVKLFVVDYANNYQDPLLLRACKNSNGLVISNEGDNWKVICKWINDPQFGNENSIQLFIDNQNNVFNVTGFGGVYLPVGEKLRFCPDIWYDNREPCGCITSNCSECDNPPRQYFIVNNTRRELAEFDVDWITENCNLEPSIVY